MVEIREFIQKCDLPRWKEKIFVKLFESFVKGDPWPFTMEETADVIGCLFEDSHRLPVFEILSRVVDSEPGFTIPQFNMNPISTQRNLEFFAGFFCYPWKISDLSYIYTVWLMIFKKNPWLLDLYDYHFKLGTITFDDVFDAVFISGVNEVMKAYKVFQENRKLLERFSRFTVSEIITFAKVVEVFAPEIERILLKLKKNVWSFI